MGHTKVDTTLNVYTQVIDGALRAAVNKVGSELFTIVHNRKNGAELSRCVCEIGSSGWTGTSNPPVNRLGTTSLAALCRGVLDAAGSGIVAARVERFSAFALCRPLLPFAAPCRTERA
jgi:hypothetical protein